jgi:hypothetical protein
VCHATEKGKKAVPQHSARAHQQVQRTNPYGNACECHQIPRSRVAQLAMTCKGGWQPPLAWFVDCAGTLADYIAGMKRLMQSGNFLRDCRAYMYV